MWVIRGETVGNFVLDAIPGIGVGTQEARGVKRSVTRNAELRGGMLSINYRSN